MKSSVKCFLCMRIICSAIINLGNFLLSPLPLDWQITSENFLSSRSLCYCQETFRTEFALA